MLITGDMTDAGRASEWAEFLDALLAYPELAARTIMLPGNHDVNIVDRANPARLDLPLSPGKRLRQMRTLSAIAAVQGSRARPVDASGNITATLHEALAPHQAQIAEFAEHGGVRRAAALRGIFDAQFPMILPPDEEDGLGIAILNSNAATHFSFTNALGLMSLEQARHWRQRSASFPRARWIIPPASSPGGISDAGEGIFRTGRNRLINGSWFVRRMEGVAHRTS